MGEVIPGSLLPEVEVGLPVDLGYSGPAKRMALYKFDVGQTVFIMQDDAVTCFAIEVVEITVTKDGPRIKYTRNDQEFPWMSEDQCFATKAELLASL